MTRRVELIRIAAVAVAAAITVGACSGPTHSHVSSAVTGHFKGVPPGLAVPAGQENPRTQKPWAAWAAPDSIYVMTWGSGSCPRIPSSVKAAEAGLVLISTAEHDFHSNDNVCTADLAVTTSLVRLPSTVDATHALVVQIDGTSTHLAAPTS
jgi:hypothetical protein